MGEYELMVSITICYARQCVSIDIFNSWDVAARGENLGRWLMWKGGRRRRWISVVGDDPLLIAFTTGMQSAWRSTANPVRSLRHK
mgnify:CR=1 FL=1